VFLSLACNFCLVCLFSFFATEENEIKREVREGFFTMKNMKGMKINTGIRVGIGFVDAVFGVLAALVEIRLAGI